MLKSLSSRLLLAFALVIVLSVALSGLAAVLLLRDQQREAAEERVGRLAEPINLAVALLEEAGIPPVAIQNAIDDYAASFDVRVLLVNENGLVVGDTESRLTGGTVDLFRGTDVGVTRRGTAEFRMAEYDESDEDLLVFAPPGETLPLSTNRLIEVQSLIYALQTSDLPPEELQRLLTDLAAAADDPQTLPLPQLRPLVVVSEDEISSAWEEIVPPLLLAGGIALAVSVVVAGLISRSITGRLGRVTRAAQEMARGHYDQQLEPAGADEIARLASAFNVMAREVSGSQRMMRDLLANVSHELKTPLTSIQGFSQAMADGAISSPEEYSEAGQIIHEETHRMRRLVDDLIELSRLESGQAVVQREPVDVPELLRACAARFEWQLRDSGATLDLRIDDLPAVPGDERRLEQAFTNLIDNAVRHTNGGTVTVRAEANNGVAIVGVHNTGSFIPPEDLDRIFERFYQQERHRTRSGASGSAGLGLAIAAEVVQAHSGKIEAVSSQEGGTEFIVTLPLTPTNGEKAARGRRSG
jgi:signal transduction histidine kinase